MNRPFTTGDRMWVDADARAEIQDGSAMIRLRANTSVAVLNLDDSITQLQLTQGALNVRVHHLAPGQMFEVDTPNLAFTMRHSGDFRIAVDPDGNLTEVTVRKGQGEITGEGADYLVDAQQSYRFSGSDLRLYEFFNAPRLDEFDQWALQRDRAFDASESARFVSPDVIGYQDLDANGNWRFDETYGNVWVPYRVDADWAPYRDGHWSWIDPWGWTWVDSAPWGFAVSHYGRWAHIGRNWCWVPGPMQSAAFYAPALVVFVGGDHFLLDMTNGNVGGIGWFALGPHEVYQPAYSVSHRYFDNINRSNTVIHDRVINPAHNVTELDYANRRVPGAIVAVPKNAFVQSQSVFGARVRLNHDQFDRALQVAVAPVAPTEQSVRGAARPHVRPPQRIFERPVVAATEPPVAHDGFAVQRQQLNLHPGKPLDDAARSALRPLSAVAPQNVVKVLGPRDPVSPTQALPSPSASPPSAETGLRNRPVGNQERREPPVSVPQPAPPSARQWMPPPAAVPTVTTPIERDNRQQPMHLFRQPEPESPVALPHSAQPQMQRVPASSAVPPLVVPVPQVPTEHRAEPPRAQRPESAASKPHDVEHGRDVPRREEDRRNGRN